MEYIGLEKQELWHIKAKDLVLQLAHTMTSHRFISPHRGRELPGGS